MAELFKGYIKSKGKEPLGSIKGGVYLDAPPVDHDYVGVLKDNVIQLDFDDEESSKIALDIVREYKLHCDILKTSRGVHLYFLVDKTVRNQSVGIFNAIGLRCDIGLGLKDRVIPLRITKNVEVVRIVNGEEIIGTEKRTHQREWLQTYDELEVLPAFFRPIGKHDYELKNCNARNNTLFSYILRLQTLGFNKEEIRHTIKIINKFVMTNPLTEKEIDSITRDDAFSEELFFGDKGQFLHDVFGNYMLSNCHILNIDNILHIYNKSNLYSSDQKDFERVMTDKIRNLKDANRKEVFKYLELRCDMTGEYANPRYIGLKDTILDIQTGEQCPYSPKWVIPNKIEFNYNPYAYHELMDKTIDKVCCYDPQIRALFEEMVGYTLYRKNVMQVCFILTGNGSNGKSTMLNCIKKLIGKSNMSTVDLKDLDTTFAPSELHNKLANLSDDISAKFLEDSSIFKKVVTGEGFIAQKKYGQPFILENYAKMIFSANELPRVKDTSDGFSRRIVILPFNAKFSKHDTDYDPYIEDKLLTDEAIEYLLKIGIDGLNRVLYNKKFTVSDKSEAEKDDYMKINNNFLEWLEDNPKVENEVVSEVYLAYEVWASKNGCQPIKKMNFSKEVKKHMGLVSKPKSISGKTVRVYMKEDE